MLGWLWFFASLYFLGGFFGSCKWRVAVGFLGSCFCFVFYYFWWFGLRVLACFSFFFLGWVVLFLLVCPIWRLFSLFFCVLVLGFVWAELCVFSEACGQCVW